MKGITPLRPCASPTDDEFSKARVLAECWHRRVVNDLISMSYLAGERHLDTAASTAEVLAGLVEHGWKDGMTKLQAWQIAAPAFASGLEHAAMYLRADQLKRAANE